MKNNKILFLFGCMDKFRRLFFFTLFAVLTIGAYAQNKTVSGTVVDANGEPIIGASIVVKGTTNGVITDLNGNFRLTNVSDNGKIQISFVGYQTQEVSVAGKTDLRLTLQEDAKALDEVVVIGYGVQKKSDVTGAIARVNAKTLAAKPVANAFQALQGKIAGVDITSNERPGELGSIRIRGNRSLNATNSPLYVVDGVPLQSGGIETLNPRDIESIDILKDASSTAIYGSRGANGVVLITTKRGTTGKMRFQYAGSVTVENIKDKSPGMSASDYITWKRWANYFANTATNPRGDQPDKTTDEALFASGLDRNVARDNVMKGWESGTWDPSKVTDYDWTGLVTQTGISQEHTLSASGGTDKMQSFFSVGYLNNQGTQKGQAYERYNASMSVDIQATDWLKMGGSVNTSWGVQQYGFSRTGQSSDSGPNDIYSAAKRIYPYALPYYEDGTLIMQPGGQTTIYTVMDEWQKSPENRQTFRALGSFYANVNFGKIWKPVEGLSFKSSFGPDFRYYRMGNFIDSSSSARMGGSNMARWGYERHLSWTWDNQLMYAKTIRDHRFDITFVESASKYNRETASMSEQNVPVPSFKWNNMGAVDITSSSAKASMGTGFLENQRVSYLGRVNYAFMDRYLLTVSGRYDGASMLAQGNKWKFFPSMALGWRMDQESFIRDIEWIDQLKLRFGLGKVGNSSVDTYGTLGNIQSFYVPFGGSSNAQAYATNEPYYTSDLMEMANPSLSWETTTQFNYGVDYSFLKGRISGSVDIYTTHTTDLLMKMNVPTLTGYAQTWANVGETKNFGVELGLNLVPVKTRDFEWNSNFNAAYQKDKIVSLMNGKQDMVSDGWLIGQSIAIYYGYANGGLWQESDAEEMAKFNANGEKFEQGKVKPVDQNGDYKITGDDRVVLGNQNPRWTLGWTNTFNYKGLELAIELYGRLDYMISTGGEAQSGVDNQRVIDYWTPDNTDAEWQKPILTGTSGSSGDSYAGLLGFKKASFIKFRNISLGYIVPAKICKQIGIGDLKVYTQLKNPGNLYSSINFYDLDLNSTFYNRGIIFGVQIGF